MPILVYKIMMQSNGDTMTLCPMIPKSPMKGENTTIPRISVAPTVYQCLMGINAIELLDTSESDKLPLYLYATWITDRSVVHQPTTDEVPDQWISGELWIRNNCPFVKIGKGYLTKQFDLPNVPYSRYCFYIEGEELPLDFVAAPNIYGEEFSFSFIGINPSKISESVDYASANPYIP